MKFTIETLGYIKYFENITKTNVKDCFIDKNNNLVFIISQNQLSKALGKNASNIKKLGFKFKRRIKIIEYNLQPEIFIKNCIYPLKPFEIKKQNNKIIIKADSTQQRALLLGRNKQNLKALQDLVNKFFKIEIKIE